MCAQLAVLLNGNRAGLLDHERGELSLTYEEAWQEDEGSYPLSLSMPLVQRRHADAVVRPYLEGLLPDNDEILQRWGRRFGVSPRNPFSLLQHVGEDVAGAAQFVAPERVAEAMQQEGDIEWLEDSQIADRLRELREDNSAWRRSGDLGHFSLAGAQPKTALHLRDGRWGIPSGTVPTTHIIKPPTTGLDHFAENEHLCLRLAQELEISAANSEIVYFEDEVAIVVERYDRASIEGRLVRIHQEDLCQSLGITPRIKYESEGGPGVGQALGLLRDNSSALAEDIDAFVRALAFNWAIGGSDAHAKNYSVLLAPGQVRLAPFYDLVSVLLYPTLVVPQRIRLAMRIGGEQRMAYVAGRHWQRLAEDSGLDQDRVVNLVEEVARAARVSVGRVVAGEVARGMDEEFGERFVAAVAGNAETCAARLA